MQIPRFNAQIQSIQVPTMKNYQEEQNASIANSLAKFGSALFVGGMNSKKDSKYSQLLQEGKTLSGRDDIDWKQDKETLQESYNTSFYNDAFDAIGKIAQENKDNPAEIDLQSNAYIDGLVSDMPAKQQDSIKDGLVYIKNAWAEQSLQEYNDAQLQNAKDKIIANIGTASDIADSAMKQNAPQAVQNATFMNYFETVEEARKAKEISPEEEIKLKETFGQNIVVNHLGDILRDNTISAANKSEWIYRFIDGKTGDEFIDSKMSPIERIRAVNTILDSEREMKYMEKAQAEETAAFFQSEIGKARRDLAIFGAKDPQKIAQWQKYLYTLATTEEDFNDVRSVANFTFPTTTPPAVTRNIQRLKKLGLWNDETFDYYLSKNVLSESDVKTLGNELNEPIAMNMKLIPSVLAEARYRLNYSDTNQTEYNKFLSILQSDKEFSSAPLSESKAIERAQAALLEARGMAPVSPEQRRQEFAAQTTEAGLPYGDMEDIKTHAKENAQKDFPDKKELSWEDLEPYIEKELKDKMDFKKKNRLKVEIRDDDGKIITTDENLILLTQKAIIKKEMESGN